uniref:Uncharacterized protein n=1 Tax=viral metagenome TaxID=1070528 RepID=A0A6M3LR85_9ZZZZ
MYVIKCTSKPRQYVAAPGSLKSYTADLHKAQIFSTREHAEANRCPENEIVLSIDQVLKPNK